MINNKIQEDSFKFPMYRLSTVINFYFEEINPNLDWNWRPSYWYVYTESKLDPFRPQ